MSKMERVGRKPATAHWTS